MVSFLKSAKASAKAKKDCYNKRRPSLLCRFNDYRVNRWLDTTSIHGIRHVFHGRSAFRRLFWFIIFSIAFSICFYVVIERFVFFFSYPTSTTSQFEDQHDNVDFPAITFCNLNPIRKSFVDKHNLSKILDLVFHPSKLEYFMDQERNFTSKCRKALSNVSHKSLEMDLKDVVYNDNDETQTGSGLFDLVQCSFGSNLDSDDYYDCTDQFQVEPTALGLCYTFNSHLKQTSPKKVQHSGEKNGLRVIFNIHQDEYSTSLNGNSGIKISINNHGDIPDLQEKGILVSPGTNAYVGLRTTRTIDQTKGRKCEQFNPEFKYYNSSRYSVGVCKASGFAQSVQDACNCLHYRTNFNNTDNLMHCKVKDICCLSKTRLQHDSKCPEPCDSTAYKVQTSYAQFPSATFAMEMSDLLNISVKNIYRDIVAVNVYFETIGITVKETINTYDSSDFLSDLGGTLGLFMGASFISLLELGLLVFDEIRDRTFKKSWKRKMSTLEKNVFDGKVPEVTGVKKDDDELDDRYLRRNDTSSTILFDIPDDEPDGNDKV